MKSKEEQLYTSCCAGNYKNVKKLLKEGTNPNCKINNWYPIEKVLIFQHYEITKLLLEYRANINPRNDQFPLRMSIYNDYWKITKSLLKRGANFEESIEIEPDLIPKIKQNIDKIFDDEHEQNYWKLRLL